MCDLRLRCQAIQNTYKFYVNTTNNVKIVLRIHYGKNAALDENLNDCAQYCCLDASGSFLFVGRGFLSVIRKFLNDSQGFLVVSYVFCHVVRSFLNVSPPEGRPGMSDVSPLSGISGLSLDSTLLSPLYFFRLVLVLFLSYLFFCLLVHSAILFMENSSNIFN